MIAANLAKDQQVPDAVSAAFKSVEEMIKEGCLFPFTTNVDVKPMSELTKQWYVISVLLQLTLTILTLFSGFSPMSENLVCYCPVDAQIIALANKSQTSHTSRAHF